MKMLRKISALVLVIMMIAMVGTAWATDPTAVGNYMGNVDTKTVVSGNNIPLAKTIVFFNPDGSEIREPDITYTYTITPVTVSTTTVTDKDGDVAHVNSGLSGEGGATKGVSSSVSIAFSQKTESTDNKHAAAVKGTPVVKATNITVTPTDFPHAGIYRYKITETSEPIASNISTVGLDGRDNAYSNVRYLDVYISNGTSGLVLAGAVIFKTNMDLYGIKIDDNKKITTDKTIGFDVESTSPTDNDYDNDETVDKYHTYNVKVQKTTTGTLADKTYDFPFEVTTTGALAHGIMADAAVYGGTYKDGSTTTCPSTITVSKTAVTLKPQLSNGDYITLTGLPTGTTVNVKETNTTVDQYTPSITTQTGFTDLSLTSTGAMTAGTGTTQLSAAATISDKTQNSVIGLTNNLAEVSPTGYVTRFAPYALILVGGIVLLIIAKKRKPAKDDEE